MVSELLSEIDKAISGVCNRPRLSHDCAYREVSYIGLEGPIGAGKTTLAHKLAEASGSTPLLEDPAANPFLARFYQDSARYALPTQLFFLFQRMNQVRELNQADLFRRATVADFILDKDPLFARLSDLEQR